MSFLKRLFGGANSSKADDAAVAAETEYKGFTIQATPFPESGQFQTCGVVAQETGGERREHRFIRADRFATRDDAAENSLRKARQLIDEQGERLFI